MRRTFAIDTVVNSSGYGKTYVKTAGESNGENIIHPLHLTKPGYHRLCLASAHAGSSTKASLKIYSCKIYESGVVQHEYVPAVVDGVVGLQDQNGTFISAAAGTLTAGGFVPTVSQSATRISQRQMVMLTASAPGAVSYRWLKNGEAISGGENGTLTVSWRKPTNAPTDTYKAMALYTTAGLTAASEASPGLSIENMPAGLIIAIQ